jgi:transcription factor S
MVEFCEKCGGMMLPSKDDNGNKVLKCRSCGHLKSFDDGKQDEYKMKTKIERSVRDEVKSTSEILKWKDEHLQSVIEKFKCPKCGYDKAALETRQTRSADEGMTHFIICLRCGKMKKIGS